jgi:hypothetical protein
MIASMPSFQSRSTITSALRRFAVASAALVLACGSAAAQTPILQRHLDADRSRATSYPRGEGDQSIVEQWPLYRTERGQEAFNATLATVHATHGPSPAATAFARCVDLACAFTVPPIGASGWIEPGRYWVGPDRYVIISHSPRRWASRHRRSAMSVFVFHEFHNSSRNTDTFDTISSHSGSVFVPFYLTKTFRDVYGRQAVAIVQVAPFDVVSVHASNHGSDGPGVEIAKNVDEDLQPLQATAGVLLAALVTAAAPQLSVVHHRGDEGLPMLRAWEARMDAVGRPNVARITLPFVPLSKPLETVTAASIDEIVLRRGATPRIPVAERGIVPRQVAARPVGAYHLLGPVIVAPRP